MILVTGATGTTGTEVLRALRERGVDARGLIRTEAKADHVRELGAEPAIGDLADVESLKQALDGVERAYLCTPVGPRQAELERGFVEAARAAGVAHVVKLSVIGASAQSPLRFNESHAAGEQALRESGLEWTFLRPNGFMQNTLAWPRQVRRGTFYSPVPDASFSIVDARDIGEVAAAALADDGHAGKAYGLTGPEPVSYRDQARRVFAAAGREVEVQEVPIQAIRESLVQMGFPQWNADGLGELFEYYASGAATAVASGVQDVLGRPPRSLDDFARDHVEAFKGG